MNPFRDEPQLDPYPDVFEDATVWDNVRPVGRDHPVLALLSGQHPSCRWVDRWARIAGFALALCVIGGSVAYAVRSDLPARLSEQVADVGGYAVQQAGFQVGDVLVSGRTHTELEALRIAIGLNRGDPILDMDPESIRTRIESLAWVRSAEVVRQLPDIIRIRLVERVPFALWQRNGRVAVVDEEGVILPATGSESEASLPIVIGEHAPDHAPHLFAILSQEPELSRRVRAATWIDDRRWTVRLDSGIDVLLPADRPAEAWARLARLEAEHMLLERDVVAIDLRQDDRLTVELSDDAIEQMGIGQDA
ncbi:MAG: FtsQ-type POTRA domain-containing protein [Alphaproteobacteria bacterium]